MQQTRRRFLALATLSTAASFVIAACGQAVVAKPTASSTMTPTSAPPTTIPPTATAAALVSGPAFTTGNYRNLFIEYGIEHGKDAVAVKAKIDAAWQSLFESNDEQRQVYYSAGSNQHGPLGYVKDIGNDDIRTEGMSYGMMIALQLNQQAIFDSIWNWAKTYMQHQDGPWQGYFSWHNNADGSKIDNNPASDGEEWFAMALLFAAGRWGSSPQKFNYRAEADAILKTMLHHTEIVKDALQVTNMFDATAQQVVFVPSGAESTFTDPSYHLPAYYELWGRWASEQQDRQFWLNAANTSRVFFQKACHPVTGLAPDYANFDGSPKIQGGHEAFRFDAFRTISNIAVDYAWFGADPAEQLLCDRLQRFFESKPGYVNQYTLDGQPLSNDRSPGLIAMNAVASLAATDPKRAAAFVAALWELEVPTGKWRYYDGLLYLLALLHVSGQFRIYTPS